MIWIAFGALVVLVVSVVVIAVCAVRACRILDRIFGVCHKLHLQISNLIQRMPTSWNFTEWDWSRKSGR